MVDIFGQLISCVCRGLDFIAQEAPSRSIFLKIVFWERLIQDEIDPLQRSLRSHWFGQLVFWTEVAGLRLGKKLLVAV